MAIRANYDVKGVEETFHIIYRIQTFESKNLMSKSISFLVLTLLLCSLFGYWVKQFFSIPPSQPKTEIDKILYIQPEYKHEPVLTDLPKEISEPVSNALSVQPQEPSPEHKDLEPSFHLRKALLLADQFGLSQSDTQLLVLLESQREQHDMKRMVGELHMNPDDLTDSIANILTVDQFETYQQFFGRTSSVPVPSVVPYSQADTGGLKAGDHIIKYNGVAIYSNEGLQFVMNNAKPNSIIELVYKREGQEFTTYIDSGVIGIGHHTKKSFLMF